MSTDTPRPLRVVVVGAGIGGLALTAGLHRAGLDVSVHERDTDLAVTGGYHITLDDLAQSALGRLVPAASVESLLGNSSAVRWRDPDVVTDHRGRVLGHGGKGGHGEDSIDIDRITLRLLLAEAVGEHLVPGVVFDRYERRADGRVDAHFTDGSVVTADVLVGADGTHSAVARQLAGGPTNRPAGLIGVSGRTPADHLPDPARRRIGRRSGLAVGPRGTALYVGFLDPVGCAVLDRPGPRSAVSEGPTYVWGAMFPDTTDVRHLCELAPAAQRTEVLARLRGHGWAERALSVITATQPDSVATFRFHVADPRAMAPWPAGAVTAIGDAVHAVPPTSGMGAAVAIRDADALVEALIEVRDGRATIPVAVRGYEQGLRRRGGELVVAGLRPVRWIAATDTRLGAVLAPAVTTLAAGVHALRRGARVAAGRPRRRGVTPG